jgi:hypothetical protein
MMGFVRKLHLYTGLGLLSFVVMYFITGYVLVHEGMFPRSNPTRTTWGERLDYQGPDDLNAWAKYLQRKFALRGKLGRVREMKDGKVSYSYFRPGYSFDVVVSADRERAEITQTESGFRNLMVGYHRIHGYGGNWLYCLWSFMYDLACVACVVFAMTGIVIWYPTRRHDRLGWLFLGIGFGLTAAMTLYLMYTP